MIICAIHPLISMILIFAPALIHYQLRFRRWKESDLDPDTPRTDAMFQLNQPDMWSALPIRTYKKYWVIQIGIPLLLVFPFAHIV